jgi:MerR family copper efflux transcriptional regulator
MKSSDDAAMSIGQIAEQAGLATHVLRHWESIGLLSPARGQAGHRRYGPDDLYRVALILRAKEAGFSLEAIREMFTAPDPAARRDSLRRQRADLMSRIAQLQEAAHLVESVLACDHEDFARCPSFRAGVAERVGLDPRLARQK